MTASDVKRITTELAVGVYVGLVQALANAETGRRMARVALLEARTDAERQSAAAAISCVDAVIAQPRGPQERLASIARKTVEELFSVTVVTGYALAKIAPKSSKARYVWTC